jgi:hypothetical protein
MKEIRAQNYESEIQGQDRARGGYCPYRARGWLVVRGTAEVGADTSQREAEVAAIGHPTALVLER